MDMKAYNEQVIREFRANKGEVGGPLEGTPLLLLTTTGAKSGRPHTTPLGYASNGERLIVFASVLGAPNNPAWRHNVVAHPEVGVETGGGAFDAVAVVAEGTERDRSWGLAVGPYPFLEDHQTKTTRRIPVIALERRGPLRRAAQ